MNLTTSSNERRILIDGLEAYTKYGFNVREETNAGWGPYSNDLFGITGAGSKTSFFL